MFKTNDAGQQEGEPFAAEAKYFTECRLLQREVKIIMEGVSNQNILGTVLHPVCGLCLTLLHLIACNVHFLEVYFAISLLI